MRKAVRKRNYKPIYAATVPTVVLLLYVILDYMNVPQLLGLSSSRINTELFSVFLNTTVVVTLYVITYYAVDQRQIQKDQNAKSMANLLLLHTYEECLSNLRILSNSEVVRQYIVPKVNFDKVPSKDNTISNLQNYPFVSSRLIMELAKEGCIEKEDLSRYLYIQNEHKNIVSMKIIFFDLDQPETDEQQKLRSKIESQYREVVLLLEQEIKRLELICNGERK